VPLVYPAVGGATVGDISAAVWAYSPRRLTNLNDVRAARIDRIIGLEVEADGTLTADGTQQTIYDKSSTKPFKAQLLLDVANLALGDSVEVIEWVKVLSGGTLRWCTRTRFTGVQEEPIAVLLSKVLTYEYKVTLQQVTGTYRSFDWSLQVEEE